MNIRLLHGKLLLAAALFLSPAMAKWTTASRIDTFTWDGRDKLTARAGPAIVSVQLLADDLLRVRLNPTGSFDADRSWAVVGVSWTPPKADFVESPEALTIATSKLRVVLSKDPLRIRVFDASGALICSDDSVRGMSWAGSEVRVWKTMPPGEEYLGFGEKAGRLFRRGTAMTMWNSDIPGYAADTDPLYESIPFFLAFNHGRSYGIFFDNTWRSSFDMGKELAGAYSFGAEGGELNYYVFTGPAPADVLARFTQLVGHMPLPPRWALGYQQCRWSYPTETRVREIAGGFRTRNIPCDVIYLDIDYMDGYRIFTWNNKNFPDPLRMIADLAREGFKVVVIVDPGIKVDTAYGAYRSGVASDVFVRHADGRLFTGKVWPGVCAFPDFTSEPARQWWGRNFQGLVRAGVRGWWNDMNEPSVFDVPTHTMDPDVVHDNAGSRAPHAQVHNVYGMEMTRATREGVQTLTPDERVFVLTRATYAGGQRYAAAWTGDNVASWEHLGMALHMCLNLSISGQPFVGSDIGGFIGYPSGELFSRWLELGVFSPLMRAHSVINEKNKEPWEFGDRFTAINRSTISMRYSFLPYIYTVMQQASVRGVPAMRPMLFEFPDDARFVGTDDAFMFGDDLLIAPVLQENAMTRTVTLPRGGWYEYSSDSAFTGGGAVTVDAPLGALPIFVRAGSIIPTQQPVQYSDQAPIGPLTLSCYPPDGIGPVHSLYYEDDGHSMDYVKGDFLSRTLSQRRTPDSVMVTLSRCEGTYRPPRRNVEVLIKHCSCSPSAVHINGRNVRQEDHMKGDEYWSFNEQSRVISVKFLDSSESIEVVVSKR